MCQACTGHRCKQSVDSEGFQTPYRLAHALDMPVISEVVSLQLDNGHAVVEREIDGGLREVIEVDTPCVIGATKGLNEPRYPKLPDILIERRKGDLIKGEERWRVLEF